jgi:NAD-dependent dihydropyrimidine dehydrogenase PreA subunit
MSNHFDTDVDKEQCLGCGYCQLFCPKDCFGMGKNFNSKGYLVAYLSEPAKCNGCGICVRMCPAFAVEVRKDAA